MQTSDLGSIEVQLNRDTQLEGAEFVEVIGKVADSGEVLREFTSANVGTGVGEYVDLAKEVLALSDKGCVLSSSHWQI